MPSSTLPVLRNESARSEISSASDWSQRYGDRHHMRRVTAWPPGIHPPRKVRVYYRNGHWLLQWWDPQQKKNVATRVDGDLIDAVAQARQIEQQLTNFKRSGVGQTGLTHKALVEKYLADLERRADARQITPATVTRYRSALDHYLAFVNQPKVLRRYRAPKSVDRELALEYGAFLQQRIVSPNGTDSGSRRAMKSTAFTLDTTRALYQWAADPQRGNLLPSGFLNPFRAANGAGRKSERDLFGEPDITCQMAKDLLGACDDYQLRIFALLIFQGLRAGEPAFLFHEYLDQQWLRIPCNEQIEYQTKGKRDKRLPLFEPLGSLLRRAPHEQGLLFLRRSVVCGLETAPLAGASLKQLAREYEKRVAAASAPNALERQRIRDQVLHDAGGISYDQIEKEFGILARKLGWPKQATCKDLRHLFRVSLMNARVPEPIIQYMMGQSPSRAAITAYTHLEPKVLREEYSRVLETQWGELVEAFKRRCRVVDGQPHPG
jgi:integrase